MYPLHNLLIGKDLIQLDTINLEGLEEAIVLKLAEQRNCRDYVSRFCR